MGTVDLTELVNPANLEGSPRAQRRPRWAWRGSRTQEEFHERSGPRLSRGAAEDRGTPEWTLKKYC